MNFTIDERHWHKTVFRPMESRLDSRNAGELKAEFLLLAQPEINSLVVDLTHVEQVDSSGLSALLLGQRAMRLFDGELRLAGPNESVRKLLELTQLDRMFPIYSSVEEAVESRRRFFLDPDDPMHTTDYSEPDMLEEDEEPEYVRKIASRTGDLESQAHAGAASFTTTFDHTEPLGPDAPSAQDIRLGAIAAGGSFGAVALTKIMMTPETALELEDYSLMNSSLALGDEEEDDVDEIDDEDFGDEDDDLDEEDDAEGEDEDEFDEDEDAEEVEDLDEDFEDDDWDEEELEEDEEEDY